MPALDVSWIDVFTDRPFAGNPLAVVLDADPLDDGEMQLLAGELGLSETTFVLEDATRLRIFTPKAELPLAGHPVVGSVVELGRLGRLADGEHVFKTGVGETVVELADGVATMTQPDLRVHRELDPAGCAAVLGVDVTGSPVVAETAVAQGYAEVYDRDALASVRPDLDGIARLVPDGIGLAAWCEHEREVLVRFFGPQIGIVEDPATGAAAGAIGALRVERGAEPGPVTLRQGEFVGRPSTIRVDVGGEPGRPRGVHVGGTAAPVMTATIDLATLRGS
jgi:trans-2,3-dihydro-3-hydroxyanthranilate isomerase